MLSFPIRANLDLVDIISAAVSLGASIVVMVAILRLYGAYRMKLWLMPAVGIGGFILGQALDLLKEFYRLSEAINITENFLTALGIALFSLGLLMTALQLVKLATTDALTGIDNKRRLEEVLGKELERAKQNGLPLTLVFLDVDNLKNINEQQSHVSGDRVLQQVAAKLRETVRGSDLIGRFGGDEFVIVMPHTDKAAAETLLLRLQKAIQALRLPRSIPATISYGTAQYPQDGSSVNQLVELASKKMYQNRRAKAKTRPNA